MQVPFTPYHVPVADFLTVSLPSDAISFILDDLRSTVSAIPDIAASRLGVGWRFPSGGFISVSYRSGVGIVSASGTALIALRSSGVYADYLRLLSSEPHRVTRLDVALDVLVLAPPLLQALYCRAIRGDFSLSRKSFNAERDISRYLSPDINGIDTGTVYLGAKAAEVKARIYDKQHECRVRGLSDPGPCLRAELVVTDKMGVSLRDAWDPAPVYWHYMASALDGIVERPTGVPCWVPCVEGFVLPARAIRDSTAVLRGRLERSKDFADICQLASQVSGGSVLLYRCLARLGLSNPFGHLAFVPEFLSLVANDGCFEIISP